MEPACDGAATVPYTLLGFLLERERPVSSSRPTCAVGLDGFRFLRDYAARGTNALLWIALITVTALLLRKLGKLVRFWAKGSRIPGPPCPSFFGHSKLISGGGNLTGYLSKLHEKYGPIVRLWLGPTQLLVSVKDPALIKEVLVKAEDKLPLTGRAFRLAFGRSGLFVPSFEKVQKRREYLANRLNGKLLERENAIPLKVLDCVMKRVDSIIAKGILDCRSVSQNMAFCFLGATVFGDVFLAWSKATIYEEFLMMIAKDASFWASYKIPPVWKRGFWTYQLLCMRLKHLTQDFIQQRRQNYNLLIQTGQSSRNKTKDTGKEADGDMMAEGLFLEEIDGNLISKEEPWGNIMGLMFHGCLTTAGLISNILTRLVMHPEVQEKIYSEIIEVRKEASKLDPNDVQKMRFLLAAVYETARLLPAGPLLQRCSLKHDLNLGTSITVPAGAILVVPVQLVQMDDSIWGKDACQFNPHRFLPKAIDHGISAAEVELDSVPLTSFTGTSEKGVECERGPIFFSDTNVHAAFLPFGSGTRACVGQQFAVLGISTLFASLLEYYEVKLVQSLASLWSLGELCYLVCEGDPKPSGACHH